MDTVYIPNELKQYATWACYDNNKQLVSALSGFSISASEWDSLTMYQIAYDYMIKHTTRIQGLAFILPQDYICIDVATSNENVVKDILSNYDFDTYIENSITKTSLHILLKATFNGTSKLSLDNGITILTKGQYVCLTGDILYKSMNYISHKSQNGFDRFYNKYFKGIEPSGALIFTKSSGERASNLTKEIVNNRISNSPASNKYYQLTIGYYVNAGFTSLYEGCIALFNILIFYTSGDEKLAKEIFKESKLYSSDLEEMQGTTTIFTALYLQALKQQTCVYENGIDVNVDYAFDTTTCITKKFENFSLDDTGNAQRIYKKFGDILKYDRINQVFLIYNKALGIWVEDTKENINIKRLVDTIIDDLRAEIETPRVKNDEKIYLQYLRNINWLSSRGGKDNAIGELKHLGDIICSPNDFDTDPYLLNTLSGVLNTKNGQLVEHNPNFMMTKSTRCRIDMKNEPTLWLKFFDEMCCHNEEMKGYLKRAVGYSLTGLTIEQCYFNLYGDGNNGKSVFLDTITSMLGDYACVVSVDTFIEKKFANGGNASPDLARLKGIRFACTGEPREANVLDESLMKSISGGERMLARRLHREPFEFYPQCKVRLSCNNMLKVKGTTKGDWRRNKKIDCKYDVPKDKIDKLLSKKLLEELPQILGWALQGCIEWQDNGLQEPDYISKSVEEFRIESNSVLNFASMFTYQVQFNTIATGDLFIEYMKRARAVNENTNISQTKFTIEIGKAFNLLFSNVQKRRGAGGKTFFSGVAFRKPSTTTNSDDETTYEFSKDI